MADGSPTALLRVLRRRDLVAFAVNSVIGAGIFGIPALLYARVGPLAWAVILAAAALVFLITICFAEVGSAFQETGGPYLYARRVFGPLVGFQVGWLMWIARLTGFAAVVNLFVTYAAFFAPALGQGAGRAAAVTLVVAALTVVNLVGIRRAALLNNALTVAKLIPLAVFVLVGLAYIHPARLLPQAPVPVPSALAAIMLALYAFSGFEILAVPGGEASDAPRDIPYALLAGLGIVALVYAGVQVVCIGIVPALGQSPRPLADAAQLAVGPGGATFMVVGALISTLGVSHTIVLAAARLPFAMAEQGQLPAALASVHPRFHTPWISLLLSAGCLLALTLATTFTSAVTLTVGFRVLVYLITCAALPVMRRRAGMPRAAYRPRLGEAAAVVSVALCTFLLAARPWTETRQLLIALAAGAAAHLLLRQRRR